LDLAGVTSDLSLVSSLAIIVGVVFVVVQLRQNNALIEAATDQARAAGVQAKITADQVKQNYELANMDLIMRLYEFANTAEVQSAWLTVLNSKIDSFGDFQKLSKPEQVAFFQIGALFESLGVLVDRGIIKSDIITDMFATNLAWRSMKAFVSGIRERYGDEESYDAFEKLHNSIAGNET
jgi:hypothetical protein